MAFRLLHTMIRVRDLETSIAFYVDLLGMSLLRKSDHPQGRFTLAFLGYGEEKDTSVLELTYNWDRKEPYALGEGYGHMAIAVPDIHAACAALAKAGAKVTDEPFVLPGGSATIAFIEDPDGYPIELIERE